MAQTCYAYCMTDSLLPPDGDLDLVHTRRYETRVYDLGENDEGVQEVLVRGAVSDTKPPGLYVADDPEELEIHQMHVELRVAMPDLVVTDAEVVFETHPHESCPRIVDHYRGLIGLPITRGFTHKVRDLFGGPRGCTHTTALLQAMAPAVVQSVWSISVRRRRAAGLPAGADDGGRASLFAGNINTCHVWDEHGEHAKRMLSGEAPPTPPIPVVERFVQLGRKPDEWRIGS